jgi:ferrous iron transport protein B
MMAAPAGAVIWLISNVVIGDASIAAHLVNLLNPIGLMLGLNGVILVAYIVAIPANEIIIPTILMLTLTLGNVAGAQSGVMIELDATEVYQVLTQVGGWTMLTGINLMLFSLLHNPCSTTILTIWNETKNLKWTVVATVLPIVLGVIVLSFTSIVARLLM